jgi:cytochrome c oxidase subunit 2
MTVCSAKGRVVGVLVLTILLASGCGGGGGTTRKGHAAKAVTGDPAGGKRLFLAYPCGRCHVFAAADSAGPVGPDLDKVLKGIKADPNFILQSIVDPTAYVEPGYSREGMPTGYRGAMTDKQLADLVSFLSHRSVTLRFE